MKFLVDQQLPPTLTGFFRERGHEGQHLLEIGMTSSDLEIYEFAAIHGKITKDEDFLYLSRRFGPGAGLLWVRMGNCRTEALLAALDRRWIEIIRCFETGDLVVEVR